MALDASQWLNILLFKLGFTLMIISAVMIDKFRPRGHYPISAHPGFEGQSSVELRLALALAVAIIVLLTSIAQMIVCIVQLCGKMPNIAWQICMLVFFVIYLVTFFVMIDVVTSFLIFAAITFTVIFIAVIYTKAKPRAEAIATSLIHIGSGSSEDGIKKNFGKSNAPKSKPADGKPKKNAKAESSSEDESGEIDGEVPEPEPEPEKTGGKKKINPAKNMVSGIKKTGSGIGKVGKKNKNKKGAESSGEASASSDEENEENEDPPAENQDNDENV